MKKLMLVMVLVLFAGCAEDGSPLFEEDAGADGGDSDSDADTDTDSDADSDTDTDTDSDTDSDNDCSNGCDNPPLSVCDEYGNLVQYNSGTCVEEVCEYPFEIIECEYGCTDAGSEEDDYCAENPDTDDCDPELCNAQCADTEEYDGGTCVDGECQCYTF